MNNAYSAGMKERCRDGCRTSLLIAGVVLVPAIFHTLFPPCHPYITIYFMEMIFPLVTGADIQEIEFGWSRQILQGRMQDWGFARTNRAENF